MKANILGNEISWWVNDKSVSEMSDVVEAHIMEKINNGCCEGEIVYYDDDKLITGYWNIINWKDIACELNNVLQYAFFEKEHAEKKQKAIDRFINNWEL